MGGPVSICYAPECYLNRRSLSTKDGEDPPMTATRQTGSNALMQVSFTVTRTEKASTLLYGRRW